MGGVDEQVAISTVRAAIARSGRTHTVNCRWGRCSVPGEVVAAMPPTRQPLFRDVWAARGRPDKNLYYDEENFAA